jgi:ATP-dependent Lon protease
LDGTVKVLVEGEQRSQVKKYHDLDGCIFAEITEINDLITLADKELDVLVRAAMEIKGSPYADKQLHP